MPGKSVFSAVMVFAAAQIVSAGCPNGGAALGYFKSCFGTGSPICYTYTFIATGGTCNHDAYRESENGDGCGGGYTGGASVQCDSAGNTISIRPPGMGVHKCQKKPIVCNSDPWNYSKIELCCYPV